MGEIDMRTVKDEYGLYREKIFDDMLRRERKRTERSQKPFTLIMLEINKLLKSKEKKKLEELISNLNEQFRETDMQGWYRMRSVIGIICPETAHDNLETLKNKVNNAIEKTLAEEFRKHVNISYICFPDTRTPPDKGLDLAVYPEFKSKNPKTIVEDMLKRSMDFTVALIMLIFCLPLFIVISILIKIDSPGPVFFRQKRVGFGGRQFTFLKFRSMYVNNDDSVHKSFVKEFISGKNSNEQGENKTYKIVNDKRVTRVGRFLRKTSLDELPQLINVLRGEMSLVGPRPCIPYEFDEYRIWHRRRVIEVKPGITGFWQVYGRSITTFENMVRMDIRYIKYRNLLLDIILILKTPFSLFKGAY